MSKSLSKDLAAVVMMSGVIIWVERARLEKIEELFALPRDKWPQFIEVDGEKVNPSRIEGIFRSSRLEDLQRRKNGQWQCDRGSWHDRAKKCECDRFRIVDGKKQEFVEGQGWI